MEKLEAEGSLKVCIDFFKIQYRSAEIWECSLLSATILGEVYLSIQEAYQRIVGLDILKKQENQLRVSDPFFEVSLKQQF